MNPDCSVCDRVRWIFCVDCYALAGGVPGTYADYVSYEGGYPTSVRRAGKGAKLAGRVTGMAAMLAVVVGATLASGQAERVAQDLNAVREKVDRVNEGYARLQQARQCLEAVAPVLDGGIEKAARGELPAGCDSLTRP
jgi:hypothetical protein